MNERKTSSMLQRVPVILAVTAASYGLQLPPSIARMGGSSQGLSGTTTLSQPMDRIQQASLADGRRSNA